MRLLVRDRLFDLVDEVRDFSGAVHPIAWLVRPDLLRAGAYRVHGRNGDELDLERHDGTLTRIRVSMIDATGAYVVVRDDQSVCPFAFDDPASARPELWRTFEVVQRDPALLGSLVFDDAPLSGRMQPVCVSDSWLQLDGAWSRKLYTFDVLSQQDEQHHDVRDDGQR